MSGTVLTRRFGLTISQEQPRMTCVRIWGKLGQYSVDFPWLGIPRLLCDFPRVSPSRLGLFWLLVVESITPIDFLRIFCANSMSWDRDNPFYSCCTPPHHLVLFLYQSRCLSKIPRARGNARETSLLDLSAFHLTRWYSSFQAMG